MARLVVVLNRVPQPRQRTPQAGGLAVGLADTLTRGTLWFGWSGQCGAETPAMPTLQEAGGITYATMDLSEEDHRLFYVGFGNGALWPLLLFRLGLINFRPEEYAGYRAVNRSFARALAPLLRSDDLIWVHDYLLIPLAEELRKLGVSNRIGFFLHTPFVPPAIMSVLPRANELLAAMCAHDIVGFQTSSYRNSFLECVTQMLGITPDERGYFVHRGRHVRAIVDPIGIDTDGFSRMAVRAVRSTESRRLGESLADRALVISVDRLDYAKGLPNRIDAIGRMLAKYPEHRRRVSFLQVAAPSRENVAEFQRLRRQLDQAVGDVNGRFSEFDWTPLRYMTRPLSRRTLAGFYRIARTSVVTPLRDGMNLVAKEFVAAQDPADPGVLVLSRFAGAADELTDALLVNPFDADEIADAIHTALAMGLSERQTRHQTLLAQVRTTTASRFGTTFLTELRTPPNPMASSPLPCAAD